MWGQPPSAVPRAKLDLISDDQELAGSVRPMPQIFAVSRNCGFCRAFTSCSNPYAIFRSTASLHARPKNEIPTGSPKINPAGTLIFGYPATAVAFELPPPTE